MVDQGVVHSGYIGDVPIPKQDLYALIFGVIEPVLCLPCETQVRCISLKDPFSDHHAAEDGIPLLCGNGSVLEPKFE